MKYQLWYSVVVRDRHGKVLSREQRKSRSFLEAWNRLVYVQMRQGSNTIVDIGGVGRSTSAYETNFAMNGPINNTNYGIVIGTGNTPVAIDDYQLDAQIMNGVGGGQMQHLACAVATSVVAAPSCSFLVSRTINNNSGAEITVREAAIYMRLRTSYYGCGLRDVFGAPQAVPNGGSIIIEWTIGVTV